MFYFRLVLVLTYAGFLGGALAGTAAKIRAFAALDQGMVALLGISHAGLPHPQGYPAQPGSVG